MIYRLFFKLVLLRIDAERAHSLAVRALRVAGLAVVDAVVRSLTHAYDDLLHVEAMGVTFPNPLGVAAGMDKEATCFEGLGTIGFGYVEVGTITAKAQKGTTGRRIWRLPKDRALLNAMGFPNPGAAAAADRLHAAPGRTLVGVNIGRSIDADDANQDYRTSVRHLASVADYLVLNVSSPNTPGLRDMQAVEALRALIGAVRQELELIRVSRPLLVKIAPDLDDVEIDAIADLALELELDGIVAVNTTVDRSALTSPEPIDAAGRGGVSGVPLKARALEVLRRLYDRVGDRIVLISVGGIDDDEEAWERIRAGATLLQVHTGFVYGGPLWPRRMTRRLSKRVRQAGASSIQELVGAGTRSRRNDIGPTSNGTPPLIPAAVATVAAPAPIVTHSARLPE